MTTATLLPPRRARALGWLAPPPMPAGVSRPVLPSASVSHPTQATLRWA